MTSQVLKSGQNGAWKSAIADPAVTPPGMCLGRKGSLETRLANGAEEVAAAQALRYKVFYEELSARPDEATCQNKRDIDRFDEICDHLLVVDHGASALDKSAIRVSDGVVVGTYRLLRQDVAERTGGFYTSDEFDITTLIAAKPDQKFLELGRSCVLAPYRNRPTVELLWQGIWNFVDLHNLDVMVGCASLEGVNPDRLAMELSFLHHKFRAPKEWRVSAVANRYVEMNRLPADVIDPRKVMRTLPPLIKGYLRLGAYIGDGAVVDHQFHTTDVLIVLPVSAIDPKYVAYFGSI